MQSLYVTRERRGKMKFYYCYRITYESGEVCERRRDQLCVEVSKEEYEKIINGVLTGIPIEQIAGISSVIAEMKDNVMFTDRWRNKNGSWRKKPLKKNRAFSKIELFMTDSEYTRIQKMKNPIETLKRSEEHMTIFRSDGSFVSVKYENGQVTICDSREKNVRRIVDADNFIGDITR